MGCFTACFDPKKHKKLMKKLPNQSLSPSDELLHEAVEISAAGTESQKEEGIVNCTKLLSESESKNEEQMNGSKGKESDNSNVDTADTVNSGETKKGKLKILGNKFLPQKWELKEVSSPLKPIDRENNKKSLRFAVLRYSEDKENVNTLEEKLIIPIKDQSSLDKSKTRCDDQLLKPTEIPMDTSLSSWLVGSEKSAWAKTSGNSSPGSEKNYGERPVLGVITSTKESNSWLSLPLVDQHRVIVLTISLVSARWAGIAADESGRCH
ncbi:hypothetical protein Sango_0762200 [Sesamum angolense]|uniref:Uncharacterized protein n=1 Tax=Sesamum angolense TaxID=2727404 RepID=A0AAE1X2G0_9LAMI|nr:hypothetical protein Sango_0762200 [Sesamum angolense]